MIHAHPALRKSPKWLVTPGVFVVLAVLLSGVPTARAPYEDVPPDTQFVSEGYVNGTFVANVSESDDTYISYQLANGSFEENPGIWLWNMTAQYNWTGVSTVGDRWQVIVECNVVPYAGVLIIAILTPPATWNERMACPWTDLLDSNWSAHPDTQAHCIAFECLNLTTFLFDSDWNLTSAELDNGTPSFRIYAGWTECEDPYGPTCAIPPEDDQGNIIHPWNLTWTADEIVIRRVYTVAAPPSLPSPLLDWMLILILLILWVSFSAIGMAKPSGLLFMGGALCGVILAFFFVIPVAVLPGIAVLGLAMTCMLGGAGIAISSGGEAG